MRSEYPWLPAPGRRGSASFAEHARASLRRRDVRELAPGAVPWFGLLGLLLLVVLVIGYAVVFFMRMYG